MQTRKTAGCVRNFMGMNRNMCDETTTQLYAANNASASPVWLVEPLVPSQTVITAAGVVGNLATGALVVTLAPSTIAGYLAISNYTVTCKPTTGPSITAVSIGSAAGAQVRPGVGCRWLALPVVVVQLSPVLVWMIYNTAMLPCSLSPTTPHPTPSPAPPALFCVRVQRRVSFQPGQHQTGTTYTCSAFATPARVRPTQCSLLKNVDAWLSLVRSLCSTFPLPGAGT